jgi:hypothetical protein
MDNPLTSNDIKRIFNNKIKVIPYEDLTKYNNIEDLLHPYNKVMILYVWKKNPNPYGHWICLFINCKGNYEVFDSYGTFIDDTLNDIDKNFRLENNEYYKQLTHLLYNSNKTIEYNNKKLQDDNSSTCGKWCSYRMLKKDLDINDFCDLFTDNTLINDRMILKIFN